MGITIRSTFQGATMRARISALLLALVVLMTGAASAQETTGKIAGSITDSQGLGVPGATVTVTGPQGSKSFVTDGEGRYVAPFLVPGVFSVRVELQGFKSAETKEVQVRLGATTNVDLTMEVGNLSEVVEVTGAATAVDTRSTTTGLTLSNELLKAVPVGRRMTDALYLAPGVSSSGAAGTANPSIAGGTGLDNQYVVDGVNITNQGYGGIGSYSIIFGSLGTATPFDFIKEVQVKTGGYEAEYGQSLGGVVNVVTKSGSNQWRGSAFAYTRPSALEAAWKTVTTANGTVNTVGTGTSDAGFEMGFPLVQNRLFLFGAIDPTWETRDFTAPPGFPLASQGAVTRERVIMTYATKATWQATNSHRIDASFFGDPATGKMGPQRTSSLLVQSLTPDGRSDSYSEIKYGGHNQAVKYDGVMSNSWLIEAGFSNAYNQIAETPLVDEWRVTDTTVTPQRITGGIGAYEKGNVSKNRQYAVKSTHVFGGHQIKYGFTYDDVDYEQRNNRTGPEGISVNVGGTVRKSLTGASVSVLPDVNFGRIYRITRTNFNNTRLTKQNYQNFFFQDTWRVNDRLTLNPGLRYEQESLVGTIRELGTLDGQTKDSFDLKNNWAPRIGVTYDILGGGRSKLYGNWGRFYGRIPNDVAARALSGDDGVSRADYFDAALTQQIPEGTVTRTSATAAAITQHVLVAGVGSDLIDPETKLSYKDEFVGGFEWQAFNNTTLGIRYIRRNIGRVLEDIAQYPAVACDFGIAAACSTDYILTNPSSKTEVLLGPGLSGVTFEDPEHTYNAVELTADRRLASNLMLTASYRWSRLHGNFEGFFRDDNGQSDPGITSLYDFPTGDPTFTAIGGPLFGYQGDIRFLGSLGAGPLPLDRPHQLKIFGNYAHASGLAVGMGLTAGSGKPLTAMAALAPYDNDSEIPLTKRGEGFQTIDGFKKRTPMEMSLDMQASYGIRMDGNRKLTLIADAFNLFNLRRPIDYNAAVEYPSFGVTNPDFGTVTSANVSGQMYGSPFRLRLGARFEF
ncbi:MAG: TonB-dependent receptor [Vicinamibacterales bacterium]